MIEIRVDYFKQSISGVPHRISASTRNHIHTVISSNYVLAYGKIQINWLGLGHDGGQRLRKLKVHSRPPTSFLPRFHLHCCFRAEMSQKERGGSRRPTLFVTGFAGTIRAKDLAVHFEKLAIIFFDVWFQDTNTFHWILLFVLHRPSKALLLTMAVP